MREVVNDRRLLVPAGRRLPKNRPHEGSEKTNRDDALRPQKARGSAGMVAELCAAEETHWWYAGLQNLIARIVRMPDCRLPARPAVLDVGCGTGANLRLLGQCLSPAYLGGFDLRRDCVTRARQKCPAAEVYVSDLRAPEMRQRRYDLVLCCDVISSIGLAQCRDGLRAITSRLSPEGMLLVHVPACPRLLGTHDSAVGTVERYRPDDLRSLLDELGLAPQILGYRMSLLFPAVAAVRLGRSCLSKRPNARPRSDLRASGGIGSRVWRAIVAGENLATSRGFRWPIGSSLVAVARRA
ncbi:MAG TPA: methyltransferase domain-containing protein [Pirellulales bacterium]